MRKAEGSIAENAYVWCLGYLQGFTGSFSYSPLPGAGLKSVWHPISKEYFLLSFAFSACRPALRFLSHPLISHPVFVRTRCWSLFLSALSLCCGVDLQDSTFSFEENKPSCKPLGEVSQRIGAMC